MVKSGLEEALERHREELERLPGVVGSGIGLAGGTAGGEVVIQVFVDEPDRVEPVRRVAERLLEGQCFEVTVMGIPEAQTPSA